MTLITIDTNPAWVRWKKGETKANQDQFRITVTDDDGKIVRSNVHPTEYGANLFAYRWADEYNGDAWNTTMSRDEVDKIRQERAKLMEGWR